MIFMEGFQHPTRPVIRVGTQKPHATAAQVLAALPAITALAADSLDEELDKIADTVACRLRGAEVPRPDLAKLPVD